MSAKQKQVRETVKFIQHRIARRNEAPGPADNRTVRFVPATVKIPAEVEGPKTVASIRLPNGVVVDARGNFDLSDLLTAAAAL